MVSLTLTPFAPWHAAHTVAALALPASISAACANGATARTTDNPSTFFMGLPPLYKDGRLHLEPGLDNAAVSDDTVGVVHLSFSHLPCKTSRESSTQGGSHDDTPDACALSGRHRARRRPGASRVEAPMGRIQPGRHQAQSLFGLRRQGDRPAACRADDSCARGYDAENAVARRDLGQSRLR